MAFSATAALWVLPFVAPLCLYVALTDLRAMRIANGTVAAIALIFVLLGPLLLPFETYLWQLAHLPIVLVAGIVLNAAGIMGAGDAKFAAAASPTSPQATSSCWWPFMQRFCWRPSRRTA